MPPRKEVSERRGVIPVCCEMTGKRAASSGDRLISTLSSPAIFKAFLILSSSHWGYASDFVNAINCSLISRNNCSLSSCCFLESFLLMWRCSAESALLISLAAFSASAFNCCFDAACFSFLCCFLHCHSYIPKFFSYFPDKI